MMEVDFIGLDKVINHIKLTGLSKFSINRVGSTSGSVPVFELINSNSNDKAIQVFSAWAENINTGLCYKLTLFDKVETSVDEFGNEKKTKSKNKAENSTVYFKLSPNSMILQDHNIHGLNGSVDRAAIRQEVLNEINKENEEKSIKAEIAALSKKVDEVLNGDNDDDDDQDQLNGINNMNNLITILSGLGLMKTQQKPAINGLDNADTFKNNINQAIKVLYKNNPKLDTDLLKLADISEKQPATFNMLLNTLRNM